jgi:hypothetical protein
MNGGALENQKPQQDCGHDNPFEDEKRDCADNKLPGDLHPFNFDNDRRKGKPNKRSV